MPQEKFETLKIVGDFGAAGVAVATILKWLPSIAALLTIIWTAIRLYESVMGTPFSESRFARWIRKRAGAE